MSTNPHPNRASPWRAARCWRREAVPAALRSWLLDTGSLTRRLQAQCAGAFAVRVLAQDWARPLRSEARALGLRDGEAALVRQVYLLCAGVPWVYARTVIPASSLTGAARRLGKLGTRPLGAALFAEPTLERGALEIARVVPGDPIYGGACAALTTAPAAIWGRRSVFRVRGKALLVSEFFLPRLWAGDHLNHRHPLPNPLPRAGEGGSVRPARR